MTRSNNKKRQSLSSKEEKEKEDCSTCSDGSTESKSHTQNNKKKRKRKKKKKRRRDKRRNSNVSEIDEDKDSPAAAAAAVTATNMKLIDDIIKDATETIQNNNEKLLDGSHPDLPKIVRLHRERRTKEDACLICLDNGINDNKPIEMFSSCCGQAYHLSLIHI